MSKISRDLDVLINDVIDKESSETNKSVDQHIHEKEMTPDEIKLVVGDQGYTVNRKITDRSKILKSMLESNGSSEIKIDEDPNLFKHILNYMKVDGYVFPRLIRNQLDEMMIKYQVNKNFYDLLWKEEKATAKAQLYLDMCSTVDEAFSRARFEDSTTLMSIYRKGVDINFDIDKPNKLNMFHWSVTAHGACDPHFLEMMFKYGREDIKTDGQQVFEMCCAFGDTRHIEIFMARYDIYNWNIFYGIRNAVLHNNLTNLHHLMMYYQLNKEELETLWDLASGRFFGGAKVMLYLQRYFDIEITKEEMLKSIKNHFSNMLSHILKIYLEQGGGPFTLDKGIVHEVLTGTHDRIDKLDMLQNAGFTVDGLEDIKKMSEKDLPKYSASKYIELRPY